MARSVFIQKGNKMKTLIQFICVMVIIPAMTVLGLGGCASHTKIIEHRHWELNDSIRRTVTEQLLLNIVRLRYDEPAFFLQVSSISSSFSSSGNLGVSGQIPEGGLSVLGLSGGFTYAETPTVTWSLPNSAEYLGRLMAPMGADQLTVLVQSGWDPERVFRVGIKKMNRLRNLDYRIGQGIYQPTGYDQFREVLQLVDHLSREDLIDFAYGVKSSVGGGKIPVEILDTQAIPQGLEYGLQFMTRDDPTVFEPLKLFKPLFLRFSRQSDNDPRAKRLRELLNLDSTKYSFGIVDTANSGTEQLRSESGKLAQAFDPDIQYTEIVLKNRSVMEVLYFASGYVRVPEADLAREYVSANSERPAADWLDIQTSQSEPSDAWLKVKYRGGWFYIAADDLKSRTTFTLLDAIFFSVVGNVPGAKPLLTLPVK